MRRTYRIKNKGRFITFVSIVFILIAMLVATLFPVTALSEMSGSSYVEICVKDGDTLWSLAREYGKSGSDIREIIYDICELNDISASDLIAGLNIKIPQ